MPHCPSCASELPAGSRFCGNCGSAAPPPTSTPTELAPEGLVGVVTPRSQSHPSRPPSSGGAAEVRFPAGTIVGERFRIVGLIGRGGMGEVYRADDLTLGQAVALKFLPEEMAADQDRLDRFLGEVRVARQVSHPNVCRVYDIGVLEGHHFISMELVDGDDLVTLLRQVGRFPEDKALEIARQLCAGLAAAHDRGIIHRDLKPANVMIDARGRVRITDFGLASLIGSVEGNEIFAGTPTYMAPEQLAGKEVTVRSDIYALGLVLYELFTGRATHRAKDMVELRKLHESAPTSPTSHVPTMDPVVEQVLLRCLDPDPRKRPSSPLAVAAALPGGDPLAAALAAGETPSPEMVAAAGTEGTLAPKVAGALVGSTMLLVLLTAAIGVRINAASIIDFSKSPQFLVERAREIIDAVAPDTTVVDEAWSVWTDTDYLHYQEENDDTTGRWDDLATGRHSNVYVWYRRSPRPLVSYPGFSVVDPADPPLENSGEAIVWLDTIGRLARYEAIPPQFHDSDDASAGPDWSPLFEEAQIDPVSLVPVAPQWTPPMNTDARAAWEGPHPQLDGVTLRVEAGAFGGQPVFFRVIGPWTRPERMETPEQTLGETISRIGGLLVLVLVLAVAVVIARRNLRLGRGDQRGAFRLAFWYLVAHTIVWALWADHVPDLRAEWTMFTLDFGYNLFLTAVIWTFYVALEPYLRRRWPDTLISWSRLLTGRLRDPLVGRDILIGAALGSLLVLVFQLSGVAGIWLGWAPSSPVFPNWPEGGFPEIVANILDVPVHALLNTMTVLLVFLGFGILLRRRWLAGIAVTILFTSLSAGNTTYPLIEVPLMAIGVGLVAYLLAWRGLLATAVGFCILNGFFALPLSTDLSAWFMSYTLASLATLAALLIYGYRTATAGQPFLPDELLSGD